MESPVFIGTHSAVLDEKSRMVMPSWFRKDNPSEILTDDFYVTPHQEGFLIIRPAVVWQKYKHSILGADEYDGSQIGDRKIVPIDIDGFKTVKVEERYNPSTGIDSSIIGKRLKLLVYLVDGQNTLI